MNLRNFLKGFRVALNDFQKKELKRENLKDNYRKMTLMSIIVFVMELIIFLSPAVMFNYKNITLSFLCSNLVLIPALFIIDRKIISKNSFTKNGLLIAYTVQYLYVASILYLGIAMSIKSQDGLDFMHMYIITIVGVMSFLNLNIYERSVILATSYICFVVLLILYQSDKSRVMMYAINSFTLNIIVWILSQMKYSFRLKSYIDKKELQKLAQCDSMTMLYNHESTLGKLEAEISQSITANTPLSLIMIDIDNFKEINDNKGHVAGDMIIKELARIILSATKVKDTAGRYGGDEFMIVLPNTDIQNAESVVCAVMAGAAMCSIPMTLSAGVTEYKGESLSDYVKQADKKLYKAKQLGKNRYVAELV